jgi:hypothetical protein
MRKPRTHFEQVPVKVIKDAAAASTKKGRPQPK